MWKLSQAFYDPNNNNKEENQQNPCGQHMENMYVAIILSSMNILLGQQLVIRSI